MLTPNPTADLVAVGLVIGQLLAPGALQNPARRTTGLIGNNEHCDDEMCESTFLNSDSG